jgi:6-pyruvoyltetrahydropterin/6-carboxytetrahydropterin synthase
MRYKVMQEVKFCAAHRIWGGCGSCQNIHGHNYRVEVTVAGHELNELGMVTDFGDIKKSLQWIQDEWDHALLIGGPEDPLGTIAQSLGVKHLVLPDNATAENMARWIFMRTPGAVRVRVWETDSSYAEYGE